jgi:tRNA(Ile)-lysidine synthetase-like protein
MEFELQSGSYVVAVSGGVDSVVLLDVLAKRPDLQLTVAHFDHGIRADSAEDRKLVQDLAKKYKLPFIYHAVELGAKASEARAREARYRFLHDVRQASKTQAIITAHHQDDLLETVILNLLRGTGRRGLSSLKSTDIIKRPLLHIPKKELLRYAKREGLRWREDSTNTDERYLRNYIRLHILPRFADADREVLLRLARQAGETNALIDRELANFLHLQPAVKTLDRPSFILLPHNIAREVMAEWLLVNAGTELSTQLLERLVVAGKTGRPGSRVDVDAGHWLYLSREHLALKPRER